jgi:hypothetical protein
MLLENVAPATKLFTNFFVTVQEHFIAYCRCREAAKLYRFLLSPYSLMGTATMCRTALFVTAQEHFIAYCRCRDCKAILVLGVTIQPYRGVQ